MRYTLLILGSGLADLAAAQQGASHAYLGAGVGALAYTMRSDGETFFDTTSGAWKYYGGFRLSRFWQFEGSYQVTQAASRIGLPGSLEELAFGQLPAAAPATTRVRLEIATLRALRLQPYRWGSVFAGFGISGAAVDTEFAVTGSRVISGGIHPSKNGLTIAVGTQWDLPTVSLRLEYGWWDADMTAIDVSILWRL